MQRSFVYAARADGETVSNHAASGGGVVKRGIVLLQYFCVPGGGVPRGFEFVDTKLREAGLGTGPRS